MNASSSSLPAFVEKAEVVIVVEAPARSLDVVTSIAIAAEADLATRENRTMASNFVIRSRAKLVSLT